MFENALEIYSARLQLSYLHYTYTAECTSFKYNVGDILCIILCFYYL